MRQADRGQHSLLRTKLLLGVAGAAAASSAALADTAPATTAPEADKWLPYSDVGGTVGSGGMTAGKVDIFAPVWQDLDSLIFVNLGAGARNNVSMLYDFGLGYRTKVASDWALGVYGGFDGSTTNNNNTFSQAVLDAELMSADWDVRLNGYLAGSGRKNVADQYELYIHNTEIAVLQGQEVGYSGFDGEVGYRVFSNDSTDVRIFIGGFVFAHGDTDTMSLGQPFDFGYRNIAGPKARAEVTVYDLDFLGPQSRLTVEGDISHDDVRGTTGYFGAALRIPLDEVSPGNGAQALDELDRRMVDPVRANDNVLTRWEYSKPEPVIIYNGTITSQPTNTLLYVDNTLGAGSYANPTTLHDATTRTTTNAFIVLTSKQGAINTSLSGDGVMQDGQSIVGGGETFTVEGEFSHAKFTHDFAPGTVNPTIETTSYDNVITLASDTNLFGFAIDGDFNHAVYGHNVDNVTIGKLAIDGDVGGKVEGAYGISIYRDVSGEENINISDVSISNVYYGGIRIRSDIGDGGTSTENITLSGITINNVVDGDGIDITDYAYGGSKITNNISISNANVKYVYGSGINVYAGAYGTGSSVNQTVTITGATVKYAGYSGILLNAFAEGGATVTQTASVSNSTISNVGYEAFYGYGLGFFAGASGPGSVTKQYATVTNVNVSNVYGIFVGYAMSVRARAVAGGAVLQSVAIDPSSGTYSGVGLGVYARAYDFGNGSTVVNQSVTVSGADFSHNYDSGVAVDLRLASGTGATSSAAAIYQNVAITNTTIDHNGDGIDMFAGVYDGGSATQNLTLTGVQINHNGGDGVYVGSRVGYLGFLSQNVTFNGSPTSYNTVSYNGSNGIDVETDAFRGGLINQHLYVYYTNIVANKGDGVHIHNYAGGYLYQNKTLYYSHLQQNVKFYFGSVEFNKGNGISISNTDYYGAEIDQLVSVYRETLNDNTKDGFYETSTVTAYKPGSGYDFTIPTNIHSNVYIYDSSASYNGKNGIEIVSDLQSPQYAAGLLGYSYLEQHITLNGVNAYGNTGNGFVASVKDTGVFGLNIQYITLTDSNFGYNHGNGAEFIAYQKYGPGSFGAAIQDVTISHSYFYGNTKNGLYAYAYAGGTQGRAEQHFTVSYSQFNYNHQSGIYLRRVAENGTYVTGLPCYDVQGLPGGCAFVRQTFDMIDSAVYGNTGNGITIYNYANHYGAIYTDSGRPAHTATVYLGGDYIAHNGGSGIYTHTVVNDGSYAYQYILVLSTKIANNGGDGFYSNTHAGSLSDVFERNFLFGYAGAGVQIYGNGGRGFAVNDYGVGESKIVTYNIVLGSAVYGNGSDGIQLHAGNPDYTSFVRQHNYIYGSYSGSNTHDGISLTANGNGVEYNFLGNPKYGAPGNLIVNNGRYGLYGHAYNGGYQKIEYQAAGNTITGNAVANTDFLVTTGGFQNIY